MTVHHLLKASKVSAFAAKSALPQPVALNHTLSNYFPFVKLCLAKPSWLRATEQVLLKFCLAVGHSGKAQHAKAMKTLAAKFA